MIPILIWPLNLHRHSSATSCRSCARLQRPQADARSSMTGRVVDSYTNIATGETVLSCRREETYRQGRDE